MDSWINGVGLALARSLGLMLANFSFGIAWSKKKKKKAAYGAACGRVMQFVFDRYTT